MESTDEERFEETKEECFDQNVLRGDLEELHSSCNTRKLEINEGIFNE